MSFRFISPKLTIVGIVLLLLLLKNNLWANDSLFQGGQVIVAGQIINFEKHSDNTIISLYVRDLLELKENFIAFIDEEGKFKFELKFLYPQEFMIKYGGVAAFFCSPGDSIYLEIDADILNDITNNFPNGKYFATVTGGTALKINQQISNYRNNLPRGNYIYKHHRNAVTNLTEDEYVQFLNERQELYTQYMHDYFEKHETNDMFRKWAEDELLYNYWQDLLRYSWLHPYYNGMKADSFQISPAYFSFLKEYDVEDFDLLTIGHADFLHEFYMYSRKFPVDSLQKYKTLKNEENWLQSSKVLMNMIHLHTRGTTKELFLTKLYLLLLKEHKKKTFEQIYNHSSLSINYFRETVKTEYLKLSQRGSSNTNKSETIELLRSRFTSDLIDTIKSKYQNKVLYIDFWSTTCGPCILEFPYTKEVQEHFKSEDVVFIFFASNCNKNDWKKTIEKYNIAGENYYLDKNQSTFMFSQLNITGIPHHVLINKKGTIVFKSAPSPFDKNHLIEEIENLL